ncbi:hypothetical protein M422DRAFT_268626 [Sphaerobolus stellatus SS14]|uniref:Unplaced genomic scaffold SPHSTscaffold_198, whole genome shotgun sequence n=1 Tax=Sphaerobolus stellatus (strain SS14) TaxID=990650 RepID=A0A0C9U6F6_SPHS4|nr:hypothetical protein M422DRAFT_268626 [Sphaerobolus stellatus SS14]
MFAIKTFLALSSIAATNVVFALGPPAIDLGTSGDFVILAKTGITTVPASVITGNIGVSPTSAGAITGFSLILDPSGTFATSTQVVGSVFAADYTSPTPSTLTTAMLDLQAAFADGNNRTANATINLGAGRLTGLTLTPGLYTWANSVDIVTSLTLSGSATDTWIFKIAGGLNLAPAESIILSGGALAKNVFWVVSGAVNVGGTSGFSGILLAAIDVTLITGSTLNGRILSQTSVALQKATVHA